MDTSGWGSRPEIRRRSNGIWMSARSGQPLGTHEGCPYDHVDPALVAKAVLHACGEWPVELIRRQQNRRRATYEVRFPDRVLFFKIEISIAYGFPSLALEQWALEKAAEIGLPVPEPVARDCSESKFPFRWLLLSALPGISLKGAGLAPAAEAKVVRQTGALL